MFGFLNETNECKYGFCWVCVVLQTHKKQFTLLFDTIVSSAESWRHASTTRQTGGGTRNYDGPKWSQRHSEAAHQHGRKRQQTDNHCSYAFAPGKRFQSKRVIFVTRVYVTLDQDQGSCRCTSPTSRSHAGSSSVHQYQQKLHPLR